MTPVRLEPAALRSRVKHSTSKPLRFHRWGREPPLLCFVCLPGVSWVFCGSSSRCHGFVCSLWLRYFLIIPSDYCWVTRYRSNPSMGQSGFDGPQNIRCHRNKHGEGFLCRQILEGLKQNKKKDSSYLSKRKMNNTKNFPHTCKWGIILTSFTEI